MGQAKGDVRFVNVCVAIDHRFQRTPDGVVWTQTTFTNSFWRRYLTAFDNVRVVARVRDVDSPASNWTPSDGGGISFVEMPYYHGPAQYLLRMRQVQRAATDAIGKDDAVILRIQGQVASCIRPMLRRTGRPYGVEVVGDPYDGFAPGYVSHPLRPFLRWWLPRRVREQCAGASAAAYVTEHALQRRYPPAPNAYTTHYSSIVLSKEAFVPAARPLHTEQRPSTLVMVGTMENLSKGPDTVLDAVAHCLHEGLDLRLILVGGGNYRKGLEDQASRLGLDGRVRFTGWQPAGEGVRAQLDQADLFVLPSRQEGLSRATIEAMARGLPCIASTVGGTRELLPSEVLVPPGDAHALAHKIREVLTDPGRMARMSARNLEKAKEYEDGVLRGRWTAFYGYLREKTEAWLQSSKPSCR